MASKVAALKFVDRRNCFVTLSTNLAGVYGQYLRGKKFIILSLDFGAKHIVTTWHGDTTRIGNDSVEISGLFASKLGIQDGARVVVTLTRHLPTCSSVLVEPISVDDWEILELNAAYIESRMLDQTRIVWSGEVLPIWLQGSVCVFVHISELQPHHPCTILDVDSQIVVLPRDRFAKQQQQRQQQQHEQQKPTGALHRNGRVNGRRTDDMEVTDGAPNDRQLVVADNSYVSWFSRIRNGLHWLWTDTPYAQSLREELVCHTLPRHLQTSFRVQACMNNTLLEPPRPRFDSKNPKSRSPPPVSTPLSIQSLDQTPDYVALTQPYTVCVSRETLAQSFSLDLENGTMFLAVLHKLWSPKEQVERKKLAIRSNSSSSSGSASSNGSGVGESPPMVSCVDISPHIVRVVAYDEYYEGGICLPGHLMVQDFMRQCLHLDVTGRLVLQTVTTDPVPVKTLFLVPDYGGRAKLDEMVILMAFRHWLSQCTSLQCPMVVIDGLVINVPLTNNTQLTCELRVMFANCTPSSPETPPIGVTPPYGLICGEILDELTMKVASSKPQTKRRTSMKSLSDLDPKIPSLDVKRLGGVSSCLEIAVHYMEFCLSIKPLSHLLLAGNVRTRGLLLTGEKGVGKSCFARLLCDNFASLPHLAFTQVIDCKALRGKTSESIHNCLIRAYDEAKWRQPAILVLDDLDLIAAAISGPEQELSGEAMYYARVSEVIKDLMKTIVYERTCMVVVAVARFAKGLHPSLVSSRGINFFEKCVNIGRPNQEERCEILRSLMEATPSVDPESMRTVNVEDLCKKMDGFVAKDIRRLLDKAVHAHLKTRNDLMPPPHSASPRKTGSKGSRRTVPSGLRLRLRMADFEAAMENFIILSLRDVTLHKVEEDVRWHDVGGLAEVKKTLQETLLWPMKYPELFAKAPLRLRTGILLYGAPGSGKTLLARALAKECGLNFISIKGPELLNKFIGASEQAVRDTFSRAQSAKPCVLFFDEFDSLAPRRGHDSTGVTDRVVNQFLTQLDGFETLEGVYVLAATSRPDMIDPALLRPGRLDRCIYCPLPEESSRKEILRALSRRLSLADDVSLDEIGRRADHFTGADLKALLYNAQLTAVHRQLDTVRNNRTIVANDELQEKLVKYGRQLSEASSTNERAEFEDDSDDIRYCAYSVDIVAQGGYLKMEDGMDSKLPRLRVLEQIGDLESDDAVSNRSSLQFSDVSPSSTPSDRVSLSSGSYKPTEITQADLVGALESMTPSVPSQERERYQRVYDSFRGVGRGQRRSFSLPGDALMDNKVTLA